MTKDYDEQRYKVAAAALKTFHDYGPERSLEMFYGAIDALQYAIFSIKGAGKCGVKVAVDNTRPAA